MKQRKIPQAHCFRTNKEEKLSHNKKCDMILALIKTF